MPIVVNDWVYEKHCQAGQGGKGVADGVFIIAVTQAQKQDIRPLEFAIVNLMPNKEDTERQWFRLLSTSPLQINMSLVHMESHDSKHTGEEYLQNAYTTLSQIQNKKFDGMIITGAPVENIDFEKVDYWSELCELMDFSRQNVFSTLHTCWGAMAGLYHHFNVPKVQFDRKLFGVFPCCVAQETDGLFTGADDEVMIPHSRWAGSDESVIKTKQNLRVILDSEEIGPSLISAYAGRQIFLFGHPEYDKNTLANEYKRDVDKGITIQLPKNYFIDNDTQKGPRMTWSAHAHLLARNWIHAIYQQTPCDLEELRTMGCEIKAAQNKLPQKNLVNSQ